MILKIILVIVIILIFIVFILLWNAGLFHKIEIEETEMGPYVLIYNDLTGPYKGIKNVQDEIYYALLNKEKIETYKGFGIYYDDPKKIPEEKLRSIGGCILEEKDFDKLPDLKNKYKVKSFEKQKCAVTSFPFKNPLSVMLGLLRVYPSLNEYFEKKNLKHNEMMEIYDIPAKKIIYIHPIY
jgi:hypothetical protein